MADVLVSLETLHVHDRAIVAETERFAAASDEMPLRYYLVFSEGMTERVGLGPLTPAVCFYNAYYWFKRFVAARSATRGYDAGLEQQAYQMLERAPDDIEWSVLGQIEVRLESER